jgi:peptide methionine sulfoxide reductase msrA/msrB
MKLSLFLIVSVLVASLVWWKWPQINSYATSSSREVTTATLSWAVVYKKAYFAAGCFWCAESSYEKYPWITEVVSGYAGGAEADATYKKVGTDTTGHREAVEVIYNPNIITYADLVEIFWRTANPVDDGGQYVDRWKQYTSAIWYQNEEEQKIAEWSKMALEKSKKFGSQKLVTPIIPYVSFYPAEAYHQNYYKVNPIHYKVYTSGSGRKEYQAKIWWADYRYITQGEKSAKQIPSKEELKKRLTPLQYSVTQEADTEEPFNNEYHDNKRAGIYVDIIDWTPLYSSLDKYDSGTGWPSFTKPIKEANVTLHSDNTLFSERTEVRSVFTDAHLGHVFDDGPSDKGGKRYCMNSAAMKFIPLEELEKSGYGEYLPLFENNK